jgi:hypothetical protein
LVLKQIAKIQLVRVEKELNEKRPVELVLLAFFLNLASGDIRQSK